MPRKGSTIRKTSSNALQWKFRRLPFWDRVSAYSKKNGDCVLFDGPKDDFGYGRIWNEGSTKQIRVHRAVWERVHGPIPPKMVIMHKCDVRNCIAIEHLKLGTQKENIYDRDQKDRSNRMRTPHYLFGAM